MRRRRSCQSCDHRFTTYERREPEPTWVRKRSGARERFEAAKLRAALLRAAHKRPVTASDVEAIVGRIEAAVAGAGGELGCDQIAELCLEELRRLDGGAYLQFAGTLASSPQFAALRPAAEAGGSVRVASDHGQSTPKAVPRRELDG
jgi:transcriptional repressor NrdR